MTEQMTLALSRRRFINWFLSTSAGAFMIAVLYPVSRYLIPPTVGESTAGTVTLPIKPDDVKPNSGQIFKFGSKPGILVRTPAGELRAFSAICTHLNCTVQFRCVQTAVKAFSSPVVVLTRIPGLLPNLKICPLFGLISTGLRSSTTLAALDSAAFGGIRYRVTG